MAKNEIKHMHKLKEPRTRKRDGELITHSMTIPLTTEEAILLSEYFDTKTRPEPTHSLVRAFLIQQALCAVDNDALLTIMSAVQVKKNLASELSRKDYDRAMDFIKNPPVKKEPTKTAAAPLRRVYVPEPRRR